MLNSPLDPTRARPEPWFVGSGRGLMIGVVTLCAVLLVARAASLFWMAETAWEWWLRPPPAASVPRVSTSVPLAPPDVANRPEVPPPNVGWAFGRDNYPQEAIRRGEQGRAKVRLAVAAEGNVTGCSILESSGSRSLDEATCTISVRRLRMTPARDAAGVAVPGRHDLAVRWVLED